MAEKATFRAAFALRSAASARGLVVRVVGPSGILAAGLRACGARPRRAGGRSPRAPRCRRARPAEQDRGQPEVHTGTRPGALSRRLEEIQAAQLATTGGGLHARDHGGHGERRDDLPGGERRGDRECAVRVIEHPSESATRPNHVPRRLTGRRRRSCAAGRDAGAVDAPPWRADDTWPRYLLSAARATSVP